MNGTVKQFLHTLEEMRTIYNFDDEKTRLQTRNYNSLEQNLLSIHTIDEQTGITVELSKNVVEGE